MINIVKEKIAAFVVNRHLKHQLKPEISFTNFFTTSFNIFVIMPENDREFHQTFEFLNFLESKHKAIRVFTYDHKVSLLPIKFRQNAVTHTIADTSRWNLPTKKMQENLLVLQFDVAIDLNRQTSLYNSLVINIIKCPYRIGFRKEGSDRFYNLQVENIEDSAELSYKNLLNCLNMF